MSQLVKAITATDTGNRKFVQESFSLLFRDVFDKKEQFTDATIAPNVAKVYRIGVTIGKEVMISELDAINGEDVLYESVQRTKRAVVEAIFGEFREDFYRLESAIYDRDFQRARSLLTDFQRKMYEVS